MTTSSPMTILFGSFPTEMVLPPLKMPWLPIKVPLPLLNVNVDVNVDVDLVVDL